MDARSFFETAREASRDAERCNKQLKVMEGRMLSLGSPSGGPRVSSTPDPHRMSARVDAYVDREAALERRMERNYAMIELACQALYGDDAGMVGLDRAHSIVGADALWWRYLDDSTWRAVGSAIGYSPSQCQCIVAESLRWMDATGHAAEVVRRMETL